tara:strand:+ start:8333 stop:9736 length:1404 start_codon:yes stop_codon:yes gene_type:complete
MATHDYDLANQSGASFRSDLNNALQAILTNNSSASAPSVTAAYMFWADTNTGILKIRNSSNNGWVELLQLDGTLTLEDGSASTPALAFRDDLNTGIFSSEANKLDIACAGGTKLQVNISGIIISGTVTDNGAVHDGDVTFTGAAANIVFDKSDNALEFADNAKATFGGSADLTISHDGSNSIINDAGTGELQLQRGGSTVLALDANGVTITDPNGATVLTIKGFEGNDGIIDLIADEGDDNGDKWRISSVASDNDLIFLNDTSGSIVQKWGIDTSGNVVQTGNLTATLGTASAPSYTFAGDTDTGMFRTDATSNDISFTCAGTAKLRMNINAIFPATDDSYDVGQTSFRFDDVFATNGTIQTSDQNTKNTITATDLGLDFINKLNPVSYKFNGKTRTHYGLIAQEIETVLGTISKSATDFAGFCKDEVDSEGNSITPIYGLRYTEFISPIIKAIQELSAKVTALEGS